MLKEENKTYQMIYSSIFGNICITSDGITITKLNFVFDNDKTYKNTNNINIFKDTIKWLDLYFNGIIPDFTPKYSLDNLSPFCLEVLNITKDIPYGTTITYNDIAKQIASKRGINKMSAQAVGQALNKNPLCIIIPCHRVIGSNGKLIGYYYGTELKSKLINWEKRNDKNN